MPALSLSPSDTTDEVVLGVSSSFCGRSWVDRLDSVKRARALAIAQRHGVSDLLACVLAGRDVGIDNVDGYLAPTIRTLLPDPHRLTDMEAAVARIVSAIERAENIAIFGDYDVDGATSAAVLASLLRAAGSGPRIYIPDRIFEGYGPNIEAVRTLARSGVRLLITVDCGTTSHGALAEAKALGMDVVVLDHHQTAETLPDVDALVNPKRQDDVSGQDHLAAVGVVFLAVVAVNRALRARGFWTTARPEPDLLALLDLVALGTVADVVPLCGINRAFVKKGLAVLAQRRRPGLRALADIARLRGTPNPYHLGFLIGPRINAGGRIGRADLGTLLLTCEDETDARELAENLDRLNSERQEIERATLAAAEDRAANSPQHVVVAAAKGWHPGVLGLVAARLKEGTGKPSFAISLDEEGAGTGSGRSIPGVDIGLAVRTAVERGILIKGGGHAMAAGVTLPAGGLEAFTAFLEQSLMTAVDRARRQDRLKIDGVLSAAGMSPDLCKELSQAGPFGAGNPEPVFALASHTLLTVDEVGAGHLRLVVRAGDGTTAPAIAFRTAGQPLGLELQRLRGQSIHLAGSLQVDEWRGREAVTLRVQDAARPS